MPWMYRPTRVRWNPKPDPSGYPRARLVSLSVGCFQAKCRVQDVGVDHPVERFAGRILGHESRGCALNRFGVCRRNRLGADPRLTEDQRYTGSGQRPFVPARGRTVERSNICMTVVYREPYDRSVATIRADSGWIVMTDV